MQCSMGISLARLIEKCHARWHFSPFFLSLIIVLLDVLCHLLSDIYRLCVYVVCVCACVHAGDWMSKNRMI
jgi:hypothetical protein